jgi:hypothetical protein
VLNLRLWAESSHGAFSTAAWSWQRFVSQGFVDNIGYVTRANLLLGPEDPRYLRHNLVHVYSEWLLDHIIGNKDDRLPSEPWLYDGIGEFEALRYEPGELRCVSAGQSPFDVTRIHTADHWMQLRRSPTGSEEYCLAALEIRRIVSRIGWSQLLRLVQRDGMELTGRKLGRRFSSTR